MILGSHNAWSYLPPKKWYMRPFRFVAQCQDWDIKTQYAHGVRCFDLRLRYNGDKLQVVHGAVVYKIDRAGLMRDLKWLNSKEGVYIRLIYDVRNSDSERNDSQFDKDCDEFENSYPNITFWCGKVLDGKPETWRNTGHFEANPSCEEKYSSVDGTTNIYDLCPRSWAKKYNKKVYSEGTTKDILLIDFVNYVA